MRTCLFGFLVLIAPLASGQIAPTRAYTDPPAYTSVMISPNGGYLAMAGHAASGRRVVVANLPRMDTSIHLDLKDGPDAAIGWENEKWLLIEPRPHGQPTGAVIALDAETGRSEARAGTLPKAAAPAGSHPDADFDPALSGVDAAGRTWVLGKVDHFPVYSYPDPAHPLAKIHAWLCKGFPAAEVSIASYTNDLSKVVALVSSPSHPDAFYVVDAREPKILKGFPSYPQLKDANFAEVAPFEFGARDGLKIRGYLTIPGMAGKTKLPTVVLVHGGLRDYDRYRFDPESQLLASHGYAVLQINYRGSGGRGRAFENAEATPQDLIDGVRWAIGDGVTDAARVCLAGRGSGADLALAAAASEPKMFRCAIHITSADALLATLKENLD